MTKTGTTMFAAAVIALALLAPSVADAGCGCDKAPPVPADVRPHATYPGGDVTIFHPALVAGEVYGVFFSSWTDGRAVAVNVVAETRRDLADGVEKVQLAVAAPSLPIGPVAIRVEASSDGAIVLDLADEALTLVGDPVPVSGEYGESLFSGVQAAVGRDGTTYVALDLGGLQKPTVLDAQAVGHPLRFSDDDVVFYNSQGFVMQRLLQEGDAEPVPGMYAFPSDDPGSSDVLHYARHEFTTYWLQHAEREAHEVDPADPRWHLDGTPHIDHDRLILAISGRLPNGDFPSPGETTPFDLSVTARSLFSNGLVGREAVTLENTSMTDSYDSTTGVIGAHGDVFSNGQVLVRGDAMVAGDATGSKVATRQRGAVLGEKYLVGSPESFMEVQIPSGIPDLGAIRVRSGTTTVLRGPGSFQASDLQVDADSLLYVDNSSGPVTLYVAGGIQIWDRGRIETADDDPEKFAIYVQGSGSMNIWGEHDGRIHGVIYAPHADLRFLNAHFMGALVANSIHLKWKTQVHYDENLRMPRSNGIVAGTEGDTTLKGSNTIVSLDATGLTATSSDLTDITTTSDSDTSTTTKERKRANKK